MQNRPTLQSVAGLAAVSRQTVSNVLNAPHLVRPETLQRVQDVIKQVGYRPHGPARQLRTRRSQVIGLRLEQSSDEINGAVLDRFLHALTEQAQLRGYRVMLFTAADDLGEIGQYSELIGTLEVDAFVLTSTHRGDPRTQWLAERGVPFVTFGRPWNQPGDVGGTDHAWVDVDGSAGTRAAVEHLQAVGHTRIAFIGWPLSSDTGTDRRTGWQRAMRAVGTPAPLLDALDVAVPDGIGHGRRAALRLDELVAPTAYVCTSDSIALGVLAATRTPRRQHPQPLDDDVPRPVEALTPGRAPAVIGFDDTPSSRAIGLSSVAQPLTEAAAHALALLLNQLEARRPNAEPTDSEISTPDSADQHVLLSPSLVIRDSSRPSARPGQAPADHTTKGIS